MKKGLLRQFSPPQKKKKQGNGKLVNPSLESFGLRNGIRQKHKKIGTLLK